MAEAGFETRLVSYSKSHVIKYYYTVFLCLVKESNQIMYLKGLEN